VSHVRAEERTVPKRVRGNLHVLSLLEGEAALVESPSGAFKLSLLLNSTATFTVFVMMEMPEGTFRLRANSVVVVPPVRAAV
jgi:hypothetical protein